MERMIGEPRVVPAGRGLAWWGEGFRLFAASVGTWLGIMLIYIVLTALISLVPYVGTVGHWLLTPVFMGGLMIGCAALRRQEPLRVAHLFEGFQGAHFVPLMIIGAINIAIGVGLMLLTGVSLLASIKFADLAQNGAMSDPLDAFFGSTRALTGTSILATLVVLVLGTVFAMLNWFAPALVALRGATAFEAMKLSFTACLRNWLPFTVYGLVAIALIVGGMVVFGILAAALGVGAFVSGSATGIAAMIGLFFIGLAVLGVVALVVGPIVFGSTFSGYEDTLATDDSALGNPAYH